MKTVYFSDPRFTRKNETAQVTLMPANFEYDGCPVSKFEYNGRTYFAAQLKTRRLGLIWLVLA